MYRGFGASAASVTTYKALYFGLYDSAKARLHKDGNGRELPLLQRVRSSYLTVQSQPPTASATAVLSLQHLTRSAAYVRR